MTDRLRLRAGVVITVSVPVEIRLGFADLALRFPAELFGLALDSFTAVASHSAHGVANLPLGLFAEALDLIVHAFAIAVVRHSYLHLGCYLGSKATLCVEKGNGHALPRALPHLRRYNV